VRAGESEDVEKSLDLCATAAPLGDQRNRVFAGTAITSGQGQAVVVAIGATAQIGRIKTMLDSAKSTVTPLQHSLEVFGRTLSIVTIFVGVATFFLAWRGRDIELAEAFAIAVGIAVAIIPEGLPSVVTIILAIGVRKMAGEGAHASNFIRNVQATSNPPPRACQLGAEHNAIIRQLPAVETLGWVSAALSARTPACPPHPLWSPCDHAQVSVGGVQR